MLEKKSPAIVIKRNAKRGEKSKPSMGGINPRKMRKYGSVIFPNVAKGWR